MPFHFQDAWNLAKKLTLRRSWNAVKVLGSYYLSKYSGRAVQWGIPISISVEPTTSCNLRCPECPSGLRAFTRPTGMLSDNFFRNTIDQLHKDLFYLIFYFQGEPYLNPGFLDMVRYAADKGLYTATSTNAHYLTEENARKTVSSGLDRLIISIDGTTQDVYQQYRVGGKLDKVLQGARNVVKAKKEMGSSTPFIIFQFLVVKPNEHQIGEAKKLADSIGVDALWLKTAQVYDYINDPNQLIPTNEKYSRYKKNKEGQYSFSNKLLNHCWRAWHATVITWDGLVVPCCFDKDAQHRLGDLKKASFQEIWQDPTYQRFRASLLKSRANIEICANCSEGTRVWGKD